MNTMRYVLRNQLLIIALTLFALMLIGGAYASAQTLTTLYSFGSNQGDGVDPQGGIVFGQAGILYGTAAVGGIGGSNGTVFVLTR
jgi:hypothetical protein